MSRNVKVDVRVVIGANPFTLDSPAAWSNCCAGSLEIESCAAVWCVDGLIMLSF